MSESTASDRGHDGDAGRDAVPGVLQQGGHKLFHHQRPVGSDRHVNQHVIALR